MVELAFVSRSRSSEVSTTLGGPTSCNAAHAANASTSLEMV